MKSIKVLFACLCATVASVAFVHAEEKAEAAPKACCVEKKECCAEKKACCSGEKVACSTEKKEACAEKKAECAEKKACCDKDKAKDAASVEKKS